MSVYTAFVFLVSLLPTVVFGNPDSGLQHHHHPMITATPEPGPVEARDLVGDITSAFNGIRSTLSSYVMSAVPQIWHDLPIGEEVERLLGIGEEDMASRPIEVLNLPAYANWSSTSTGTNNNEGDEDDNDNDEDEKEAWRVYVHGNTYKIPSIVDSKLFQLVENFLADALANLDGLSAEELAQAKNMTAEVYVVQQKDVEVTIDFAVDDVGGGGGVVPDGDGKADGVVAARSGAQQIKLPEETNFQGDFSAWLTLTNNTDSTSSTSAGTGGGGRGGYLPGSETDSIQTLSMHAKGTTTINAGNATAYLVPSRGITIVSDIDDILRVAQLWDPRHSRLNSFTTPFRPFQNMPEIYAEWARQVRGVHFHYLTTSPEQVARSYMEFTFSSYPHGSFDTRPPSLSNIEARKSMLGRILESFPERKFFLMADTSNTDAMQVLPQLAKDHPGAVRCIWLRNTTSTDDSYRLGYDTTGFKGLEQSRYMFFNVPDDLRGLNITRGECYNATVPQNVMFGPQGSLLSSDSGGVAGGRPSEWVVMMVAMVLGAILAVWC